MLKINDVTVLKFKVSGKNVEKTVKVCSFSGYDKKNRIRFIENENFKMKTMFDESGKVLEECWTENGVACVKKIEYKENGIFFEKKMDSDGTHISKRTIVEKNGKEIIKENGKETIIEIVKNADGTSVRKMTTSINGEVYEIVERHKDKNNHPVYTKTERNGNVFESWCEFDDSGYCVHQKDSDGTEFRNQKSDDGRFIIRYEKINDSESINGITEILSEDEMDSEVYYELA